MIVSICIDDETILDHRDEKKLVEIENSKNIIFAKKSVYNDISILDTTIGRLLLFDKSYQGGLIHYNNFNGGMPYTRYYHLANVINDNIKNILVLGLGSGSFILDSLKIYDFEAMDVVEIDPDIVNVAYEHFGLPEDHRLKIFVEDARDFVFRTENTYDLIIIDVFLATGMPLNLMTKEFITKLKELLNENGVIGINLFGSEDIDGDKSVIFKSLYKCYKSLFPSCYVFPVLYGAYEFYRLACNLRYNLASLTNIILLASNNPNLISKNDFIKKAISLKANTNVSYLNNFSLYARDYFDKPIVTDNLRLIEDSYLEDRSYRNINLIDYINC